MPRPRTVADEVLLTTALDIVHRDGPAALSFGALASAVGLAGSTIVQRYGTKAELLRATLTHAWDRLDAATAATIARAPDGAAGIVELFVELTGDADDEYAEQLPVLREDLRDPTLRRRGAAWLATLAAAVDTRLPDARPGTGALVVAQWQGVVTVWSFERDGRLADAVRRQLGELLARAGQPSSSRR